MKIQILWNIKDGTYPHFMKARPEMNDNPVYKGKVFPLNKEIVLLMKEKKCDHFSLQQGVSGGGFLTEEEYHKLEKIFDKITSSYINVIELSYSIWDSIPVIYDPITRHLLGAFPVTKTGFLALAGSTQISRMGSSPNLQRGCEPPEIR